MAKQARRVVITGLGAVSPYGVGANLLWENLKAGKNGISKLEGEEFASHGVRIAGQVKDFKPSDYLDPKEAKRMDRYCQFAMVAAQEAAESSGIDFDTADSNRIGVCVGSAAGGIETIEKNHSAILNRGPSKCSPFTVPMMIADISAGRISIKYKAKGPNKAVVTACATAGHSIGDAFRIIQYGDADVMFAGGAEAAVTPFAMAGFTSARTLSNRNDEPQKASRPFDKDRDGFIMAEGAGILILEELEHAKARGANILAELVGYGATGDANDVVAPCADGDGAGRAMECALNDAELTPKDVNYINTHGTSTGLGDIAETLAVERVFGDYAKNGLLVSSTKSMIGHSLGATGGIEAVACVKAMQDDIVPPTINLDEIDERIPKLDFVPHKAREVDNLNVVMSNSFGFGGHNASLVFKKFEA